MKRLIYFLLLGLSLSSCVLESDYNAVVKERNVLSARVDSLDKVISALNKRNSLLSDSLLLLSFPADQRYLEIVKLVKDDKFELALERISELKKLFPNAAEVNKLPQQISIIENKKAALKAEEERRKALGFKIFKDKSKVTIEKDNGGILTCNFSEFSFGGIFSFDYIRDVSESYCRYANKNNTYILAKLSLTTKMDYAYPPSLYACRIEDGKLKRIGYFTHEYETWDSYGAYIGNYNETSHDFSKVNTVRFCLASEISIEDSRRPIVVVMFKNDKSNGRKIDGMNVEEVNQFCDVIRIINRNKI